jgi:hypothetical protein
MNQLCEITLRWYDDSSLITDDRRELVERFMDSLGISRGVASDLFEVLLLSKAKGDSLTSQEIKKGIIKLREKRKDVSDDSLTLRNIQIWVKYFRNMGLIEKVGGRYLFKGNKKPSAVFKDNVKPEIIDKSAEYIERILEKLEKEYEIKK